MNASVRRVAEQRGADADRDRAGVVDGAYLLGGQDRAGADARGRAEFGDGAAQDAQGVGGGERDLDQADAFFGQGDPAAQAGLGVGAAHDGERLGRGEVGRGGQRFGLLQFTERPPS